MLKRNIGKSGIEVSAIGMGCWAIGGPFWSEARGKREAIGWGEVDDAVSMDTIRRALDMGVTFFDTADVYGCGHSERVLAKTLQMHRKQVVIATKFGIVFDEASRMVTGMDASPDYIRKACDASLKRLNTDYIDLYQFHLGDYDHEGALIVRETLEELVTAGKIRWYAWSTDSPENAELFAAGEHCCAIQHQINVLDDAPAVLEVCKKHNLASINRGPLAMGLLTGKYTRNSTILGEDVRGAASPEWMKYFKDGKPSDEWLTKTEKIASILKGKRRTLAQGALAWLLARSPQTIPIPGCRTIPQIEDNAGHAAPLDNDEMASITSLLGA